MIAALTTEESWDIGLLVVAVVALVGGAVIARVTATVENTVFRVLGPALLLLMLAVFAIFVYFARSYAR